MKEGSRESNFYTFTSKACIPASPKMFLKCSTLEGAHIALFGLSESFTVDTHSQFDRCTAVGFTTTENDPKGQNLSSFGKVPLVLLVRLVPIPKVSFPSFW